LPLIRAPVGNSRQLPGGRDESGAKSLAIRGDGIAMGDATRLVGCKEADRK
jgi:hypothetical protein